MTQVSTVHEHTRDPILEPDISFPSTADLPQATLAAVSLPDILSNSLLLTSVVPYLSITDLLSLASSNRTFRELVYCTPGVFRHLDLTDVKCAQFDIDGTDRGGEVWRNVQLDESLTEDDFYSGPLRNVFATLQRRSILQNVQTLILDGLSVTSEICYEILTSPSFNVRILSLRDAKNLNQAKLRQTLEYICRPTRPGNTPKLRGLYVFGAGDASHVGGAYSSRSHRALASAAGSDGDAWWDRKGKMVPRILCENWARTLVACQDLVAFDAVLCAGPRHINSPVASRHRGPRQPQWAVATVALRPCAGCGRAPEGITRWGSDPCQYPLLAPPPILSSSLRSATHPRAAHADEQPQLFVPRCQDCLRDRCCSVCHAWWCEDCYSTPDAAAHPGETYGGDAEANIKARVTRSCWECGVTCDDCIENTHRLCKKCKGGYCLTHNEGSTSSLCDWCSARCPRGRL